MSNGSGWRSDAPKMVSNEASFCSDAPKRSEHGTTACGREPPVKRFPTGANGRRAHVLENIPGANERHPPIKWFSTEVNGRRAPPSNVRVGAYCIRPRCSRQETIAPIGYPPPLETIFEENKRQAPPLDLSPAGPFEGAYVIRPYPTGGWDAVAREMVSDGGEWASGARIGKHSGGERTSAAIVGRPCRGAKAYAPKRSEHGTTACGREPPVKRFPTGANRRFGHLLDSNLQANEC